MTGRCACHDACLSVTIYNLAVMHAIKTYAFKVSVTREASVMMVACLVIYVLNT